jgi:hypothetical protein
MIKYYDKISGDQLRQFGPDIRCSREFPYFQHAGRTLLVAQENVIIFSTHGSFRPYVNQSNSLINNIYNYILKSDK